MAWKGLHLSRPARLNVSDNQIVVTQDDGETRIPLEDIAFLVLDAPHATLTSTLLSACMEAGIVILSVDARHTPNGIALPFHSHHRQAGIAVKQISVSEPFKKRCWQRVVVAKINNQAAHLESLDRNSDALRAMAKLVASGDPDNVEARAAREYWRSLFSAFRRDDANDLRNKMMNYGYAVARAGVARALVSYGLIPAFGLHHASATNAFNLADDLLEPFRPFVDALVAKRAHAHDRDDELTIEDRRAMAGALLTDAIVDKEKVSLLVATEKAAESLVRAIEGSSAALLLLPDFTIPEASHHES
jgi:CRISPR-associated protein Cas1